MCTDVAQSVSAMHRAPADNLHIGGALRGIAQINTERVSKAGHKRDCHQLQERKKDNDIGSAKGTKI